MLNSVVDLVASKKYMLYRTEPAEGYCRCISETKPPHLDAKKEVDEGNDLAWRAFLSLEAHLDQTVCANLTTPASMFGG
jgi:hypothetical protein